MKIVRVLVGVVLAAILVLGSVAALRPHGPPPLAVTVARVTRQDITRLVQGAGKLEPQLKVNVSSNITGDLTDLRVGIGDHVKVGQYLGQIDAARYRAALRQQDAALESARADMASMAATLQHAIDAEKREQELAQKQLAAPTDVEQAVTNVSVAKANLAAAQGRVSAAAAMLDEAQTDVSHARLVSPIDGIVLAVDHRVGERVRGSDLSEDVVLTIGSLQDLWVELDVGEHDVVYLANGQKARVDIDAFPDTPVEGKVISIARDATITNPGTDAEVTTFAVWVALENPPRGALSGMSAQVSIETETHRGVLAVPIQCVATRARRSSAGMALGARTDKVVFVVDGGVARQRLARTGLSSDTMVEITSGLREGEEVVTGPYRAVARELKDGDRIEIDKDGDLGGPVVGEDGEGAG